MAFTAQVIGSKIMRKDGVVMNGNVDALSPGNGLLIPFLSSSYIYSYFSPIISFYLYFLPPLLRHTILLLALSREASFALGFRGDPFYAERSHDSVVKNVVNCAVCVLA